MSKTDLSLVASLIGAVCSLLSLTVALGVGNYGLVALAGCAVGFSLRGRLAPWLDRG